MKLNRNRFFRILFARVLLFATVHPFVYAASIVPDTFGNITVPAATNAADTITATGGTSPSPVVTVENGAILTGDPGLQNAAVIYTPGYTVNNAGSLSGAVEGIFITTSASGAIVINNQSSGIIQGGNDAVYFNDNGGSVTNSGIIRGINGANSDGISAFDDLTVINSGEISGVSGIYADNNVDVTNNLGGAISGTTSAGIDVADNALIDNFGIISSSGSEGILLNDAGQIFNSSSVDGFGTITGGRIEGATNGIFSGSNLTLVNEQASVINGLNGIGVDAGDNAQIFNDPGAEISGSLGGVSLGALGYLENDGNILGNGGDAITLGATGIVFNTGLIEGTTGIVANNGSTINNSGIIRSTAIGGNAFSGGSGNDDLIFTADSFVKGNVLGGGGTNTLTLNGGLTSPISTRNLISGDVRDFSTVTKSGTGVALIGGVDDVGNGLVITADTIAITSGGLYFNADISGATTAQAIINAGGAAVGGTGLWNANLNILAGGISAGAIPINLDSNPVNAVGAVAITGDVVHSPGSFIRLDIVPGTPVIDGINSDIIEQIGAGNTYDVTGANLRISTTNSDRALTNGTYILVDSDEAIIGSIGTIGVQFNANTPVTGPFRPTESGANATNTVATRFFGSTGLEDSGTNLVFRYQRNYAGLPGLSENQASLGAALDSSATSANPLIQNFISSMDFSNLDAVQNTLASLSPESFIDFTAGIVNSNYRVHRMLQDHLAATRSSGDLMKMAVGGQMDSKGGMTASEAPQPGKRASFWGSVSYDWQDYEGDGPNSDFDGETAAITAGFDYRVAPALVLGILLDGSKSNFDSDNIGSDIDSLRVLVYGTWGKSTGLYSDAIIGYGNHDLDFDRSLGGLLGGSSSSSTDADSLQALWTIGYAFGDTRIKHGPFAGFEYQSVEVDGYSQSGVLPVSVDDYDDDSFRALIGYRVNTNLGRFTPYASVTYAHEFEDDGVNARASFGGAGFRVRGAERGSAVLLTAGTGVTLTDSLLLDVGYRGEISVDDEGIDSHGANVGLKYRF